MDSSFSSSSTPHAGTVYNGQILVMRPCHLYLCREGQAFPLQSAQSPYLIITFFLYILDIGCVIFSILTGKWISPLRLRVNCSSAPLRRPSFSLGRDMVLTNLLLEPPRSYQNRACGCRTAGNVPRFQDDTPDLVSCLRAVTVQSLGVPPLLYPTF